MKRLFALILSVVVFTSCSAKKENTAHMLNEFFSHTLIATSSDEKFSFEISDGKIMIIYPEILKGTEIYFAEEIKATLYGKEVKLPESSINSVKSLLESISKIKSRNAIIEEKDGVIKIDSNYLKFSENETTFSAGEKTFILKTKPTKDI